MVSIFFLALFFITGASVFNKAEPAGDCNETVNHEVSSGIRVHATPADPMPDDRFEVIVTLEIYQDGKWHKEWNDTIGELIRKPESSPQLVDRQNGTEEGIRLFSDNPGTFRVWGGICRNNNSYWNLTNVTLLPRNDPPVAIALLSADNVTSWSTNLTLWLVPGKELTIFFNGSLSHDPNHDALDYYWDLDATSPINDKIGPWVNMTIDKDGTYPIMLTVGDGNLTSSDMVYLRINYFLFPDLTISSGPLLSHHEFRSGAPINITTRIQNRGQKESGVFNIYVFDHDLDSQKNRTIHIQQVTDLTINEYYTYIFDWSTTNRADPGTHVITVYVDYLDDIDEHNESNNDAWSRIFTVLPAEELKPFVIIQSLTISNETPVLFQMVNITVVIENSGDGSAEWLSVFLLVNGEEYDIRYIPTIGSENSETMILFFSGTLVGYYNLTCAVYDNGLLQHSMGERIEVRDLDGPTIIDGNTTTPEDESSDLDWLMMGAGVFMIVVAIAIQILGRKAREK